jgi:osmotically-inducible protein OsmY
VRRVFSEIVGIAAPSGARSVGVPIDAPSSAQISRVDAEDEVIRRSVTNALLDLDARENAEIRVLVDDGVVRLTGSVPTWQGNSSRVYATRSVAGVRSILNQLRVVTPHAGV